LADLMVAAAHPGTWPVTIDEAEESTVLAAEDLRRSASLFAE
jgi:hypothetical protein